MIKLKKKNNFSIFFAIAFLLVILHYSGLIRPLETFFLFLAKPFSSRFYNVSTFLNKSYHDSQNQDDPKVKIEELEGQVAELLVEKAKYQEALDENKKLKDMLEFSSNKDLKLVTASVVAKENTDKDKRDLIINKGESDGLVNGLAVVDEHGVLVGKIIEVKDNISKICLSINPECEFAASMQNQDKTQGLVSGDLGLTIKMSFIPQLENIEVGDIVITSGLGANIPRGLLIGTVSKVKNETNEVWQEANIDPLLNFNNLTFVSVIFP